MGVFAEPKVKIQMRDCVRGINTWKVVRWRRQTNVKLKIEEACKRHVSLSILVLYAFVSNYHGANGKRPRKDSHCDYLYVQLSLLGCKH
jgi:hypothetical protein